MDSEVTVDSDKTPRWLVPVFAFIAGVAVTAGVLVPARTPTDYQSGYNAGYDAGNWDGKRAAAENYTRGFRDGQLAPKR